MDAAFWQKQWDAFVSAPVPSLIFLAIGAAAAWWFRGTTTQGQTEGLKAVGESQKAHIATLEERLRFAAEKAEERDRAKQKLENDLEKLREQITAAASEFDIAAASQEAANSLITFNGKDDEVREILAEAYMRAFALTEPKLDPPDRLSFHIPPGFRKPRPKK